MDITRRLNPATVAPDALQPMYQFEAAIRRLGLPPGLLHLVRLRVSQINDCAFCLAMHTREARHDGETQPRLDLLQAWEETALFDARERAALGWAEALTRVADTHAPDAAYAALAEAFTPDECVALTLAIVAINSWNRICVGFRAVPEPA